jgi:hypothetical protein
MSGIQNWSLIVALRAGDEGGVLKNTLLKSPDIDERCELITKHGVSSVCRAYNAALRDASNEILIFAHQDVYLPRGWLTQLSSALHVLGMHDPNWGILGVSGVTGSGEVAATVYATGLNLMCGGGTLDGPAETVSLDEMLLVMRRSSGLFFDPGLPSYHLFGTDICLAARRRGLKSYIIPAFCIHNSTGKRGLPLSFWKSYRYMRRKWWSELPIRTCCTVISRSWWPVADAGRTALSQLLHPSYVGARTDDVESLWRSLSNTAARSGGVTAASAAQRTKVGQ